MNAPRIVCLMPREVRQRKVKKPKLSKAENRARLSAHMKALWADPAFAAKVRAAASITAKAFAADPVFVANRVARLREHHRDPAVKARTRAFMKELNADPAFAEKNRLAASARMKTRMADPVQKARILERLHSRWR